MADFQKQINQTDHHPRVFNYPVDRSDATLVEGISTAIENTLDVKDDVVKRDFTNDLQQVADKEAGFISRRKEIVQEIRTGLEGEDEKAVTDAQTKLITLERGLQAGVLSPQEAQLRRNAFLRERITANPWLAPELKSLASVYGGSGVGRGGAIAETPEEKALNAARQESALTGGRLSINDMFEASALRIEKEARMARAAINFGDFQDQIHDSATLTRMNLMSSMLKVLEASPENLDATDWGGQINNAKSLVKGHLSNKISEWSKQGHILSSDQRTYLQGLVDDEFAMLDDFAKSKDKAVFLERQVKMIQNSNVIAANNMMPAYGMMSLLYGKDSAEFMNSHLKILGEIQQGTTFSQIQGFANEGDQQAIQFLQVVRFNDPQGFAAATSDFGSGNQEARINKWWDAYLKKFAVGIITNPHVENKDNINKAHSELQNSTNPNDITQYLKPDVFSRTAGNVTAINGIRNSIEGNLPGVIDNIIEDGLEQRVQIVGNSFVVEEAPVPTPRDERLARTFVRQPPAAMLPRPSEDIKLLNSYSQLVSKYNLYPNKTEWMELVLGNIQGDEAVDQPVAEPAAEPEVINVIRGEDGKFSIQR